MHIFHRLMAIVFFVLMTTILLGMIQIFLFEKVREAVPNIDESLISSVLKFLQDF